MCVFVCVCVCVCVRGRKTKCVFTNVCQALDHSWILYLSTADMCACVCVRERECVSVCVCVRETGYRSLLDTTSVYG